MNKRMRELLALINAKNIEAKGYMSEETKDVEKAAALLDEADALQKEYDIEKRLFEASKETLTEEVIEASKEEKAVKAFAAAARNGFKTMTEGTPKDGGYTVPEDIVTKINEYKTAEASLLDFVEVIPVSTNSGARTFKKRVQQTGFTKVGEGSKIGANATPEFERHTYTIAKYGGYLPVTNELLADSDANITDTLVKWLGNESRITGNNLILAELDKADLVPITGLDDLKYAINVSLGAAFAGSSVLVTNDNGLHWLDTLKNTDGTYVLQPDPANPMKKVVCAGAATVPVHVIPNSDLATLETGEEGSEKYYTPIYIGDLFEAVKFFDRQQLSITVSDTAAAGKLNAFEEDLTLFRALEREDVTVFDDAAFVRLGIEVVEAEAETPEG